MALQEGFAFYDFGIEAKIALRSNSKSDMVMVCLWESEFQSLLQQGPFSFSCNRLSH